MVGNQKSSTKLNYTMGLTNESFFARLVLQISINSSSKANSGVTRSGSISTFSVFVDTFLRSVFNAALERQWASTHCVIYHRCATTSGSRRMSTWTSQESTFAVFIDTFVRYSFKIQNANTHNALRHNFCVSTGVDLSCIQEWTKTMTVSIPMLSFNPHQGTNTEEGSLCLARL